MLRQRDVFHLRCRLESSLTDALDGNRQTDGFQGGAFKESTGTDGLQTSKESQFGEMTYQLISGEGRAKFGHCLRLVDGKLTVAVNVPAVETDCLDGRILKEDMVG